MTTPVPFPRGTAPSTPGGADDTLNMTIDIPSKSSAAAQPSQQQQQQQQQAAPGSAQPVLASGWQHHARPPTAHSDSYFPSNGGASGSATPHQPKTPRGHSRNPSNAAPHSAHPPPLTAAVSGQQSRATAASGGHAMSLSLSSVQPPQGQGFHDGAFGNGPPSPSTLTDIILGLHGTLYGGKRSTSEVREMVSRYYETDAVFESPLLAAHGREQIANQFIMAFALPGMDVTSELRDVICSDFEFDGTRAGIIDQTINVTFLPSLFGAAPPSTSLPHASSALGHHTPGYALHSAFTPHPFANYAGNSAFPSAGAGPGSAYSRFGVAGRGADPHSPTTPYTYSLWGGSRPHTPGAPASGMKPLTSSAHPSSAHPNSWTPRASTPPSVNGDDDDAAQADDAAEDGDPEKRSERSRANQLDNDNDSYDEDDGHFSMGTSDQLEHVEAAGIVARPAMPEESLVPHWSHQGLGRASVRGFVWGLLHPRQVMRQLCTIQLRLMSRLEFNDAGLIVRHEDTWGLREAIEGMVPFAGLFYAIERRVVGWLVSWAIGKGVKLSDSITQHGIIAPRASSQPGTPWPVDEKRMQHYGSTSGATEAARALLGHGHHTRTPSSSSHFGTASRTHTRSRAASPTRRFHTQGSTSAHVAGTRSRARSFIGSGSQYGFSRAASSDNLVRDAGERERQPSAAGAEFPPDAGARYRRAGGARNTSTVSADDAGSYSAVPSANATTPAVTPGATGAGVQSLEALFKEGANVQAQVDREKEEAKRAPDCDGQ